MEKETFEYKGTGGFAYWTCGNINKPALLLIPGFTGTHSALIPMTKPLKKAYFIIIPDLPGWGDSPRFKEQLSLGNYAQYIRKLIAYLKISKLSLVGHCMGSIITLEFAYQYPETVKKLVLVSPPYIQGTIAHRFFHHLAHLSRHSPKQIRPLFFFWRNRVFSFIIGLVMLRFRTLRRKLSVNLKTFKQYKSTHEDSVEENWTSFLDFNFEKARAIKAPTLTIHGKQDLIITPKQALKLTSLIPNSSFAFIPNAGHLPPVETPQELGRLIFDYLQSNP